jgi:hypothetical protein
MVSEVPHYTYAVAFHFYLVDEKKNLQKLQLEMARAPLQRLVNVEPVPNQATRSLAILTTNPLKVVLDPF